MDDESKASRFPAGRALGRYVARMAGQERTNEGRRGRVAAGLDWNVRVPYLGGHRSGTVCAKVFFFFFLMNACKHSVVVGMFRALTCLARRYDRRRRR